VLHPLGREERPKKMDKYKRGTGEVFHSLGHPVEWDAALGPEEPWKPRSRSGRGGWRGPWGITPQNRKRWYQPLGQQADIVNGVHWVLGNGNPDPYLNSAGDVGLGLLAKPLDAAFCFQNMRRPKQWRKRLKGIKCHDFLGLALNKQDFKRGPHFPGALGILRRKSFFLHKESEGLQETHLFPLSFAPLYPFREIGERGYHFLTRPRPLLEYFLHFGSDGWGKFFQLFVIYLLFGSLKAGKVFSLFACGSR